MSNPDHSNHIQLYQWVIYTIRKNQPILANYGIFLRRKEYKKREVYIYMYLYVIAKAFSSQDNEYLTSIKCNIMMYRYDNYGNFKLK